MEPGAGSCIKVRLLLSALKPAYYVPVDISGDFLFKAASELQSEFPTIPVHPICDDMQNTVSLPQDMEAIPKLIFYPGSTIGNYEPDKALSFLKHVRSTIGENGGLLIGVDLQKDIEILHQAYNDASGITAAFNLNCLSNINSLIGANFTVSAFRHIAFYNEERCRIEMHLESKEDQSVDLAGEQVTIERGERILTEYSYKYTLDSFARLAAKAELAPPSTMGR